MWLCLGFSAAWLYPLWLSATEAGFSVWLFKAGVSQVLEVEVGVGGSGPSGKSTSLVTSLTSLLCDVVLGRFAARCVSTLTGWVMGSSSPVDWLSEWLSLGIVVSPLCIYGNTCNFDRIQSLINYPLIHPIYTRHTFINRFNM